MNMYSQQREVADLFQQLKDKSYSREQRANASKALKAIVSGCMTVEQFTPEWQMVYDDVAQILCGKIGMENKRALGEVAAYLLAMLPYDLVWILDWIKGNYEKTPPKYEEERSILVGILTTGLELLVQGGMPELVQDNLIMESLDFVINSLNAIDKLTYDELLETLFNSLVMFSGCYPVQFRQKFETTIRTVLAWSVEPISAKLQRRCCELCRFFLPYWDSGLAEKLTEEYLGTFEANLEKLSGRQDKELLSKNRAMIFSVSAIIETFVEMEEQQWAVGKVTEVLDLAKNIENILLSTGASKEKALFLSSFCQVYEKIIPLWKTDFAQRVSERTVHQSLAFARQSLSSPNAMSEYLTFFSKFYGNPTIPVALTSEISKAVLGDGGLLDGIITPTTKRSMFSAVKNILSDLLTPISIVQLQESFSLIKQNMLGSISILLDSLDNETIDTQQVNIAKIKATLFAKAMEPFASITSSLIVIMGMQPSLLQVLCLEFPVYEPSFGSHFPAVQYALLKLIVTNCESHEYFLATSDWLTASKNSQITESRTSKHAQIQLETICKCLKAGIRWKPTRELVCSWLAALLARIDDSLLVQLAKRREWVELHRAVITGLLEEDVEESLHEVARRLGVMSNEHEKNIAHIVSTVHEKIANINPERSRSVRGSIDSSLFIRCSVSNKGWDLLESRQQRATVSSFSTNHFSLLADFILKGIAPSLSLNPEDDMLWIFDTINIIYGSQNEKTAPKDVNRYIQKWRWALTQMALHCVENKMKTSLGKATDTFTAIGAEIQRLGKVALGMMEDRRSNEKKKQIETVKSPKKIAKEDEDDEEYGLERELTEAEEWWRVRCLLEFVEIFDKMMFNAITGAHFPLATVSQQARQFFHANLASCNEWLSRTYPVAMIVAFHAGYYAQVIRFGSAALIDMEKRQLKTEQVAKEKEISVPAPSPNSLAVIMLMGRAMSELGAAQAAKGLQNWTVKVFKFEARWLTGAVEMASARYESALRHLIDSLHNDELPETLKIHLRAMIFDVLNKLRLPMLLEPSKCPTDMCIWTEADDLESVPAGFDADAMTKLAQLCSFSKAEHVSGNSKRWDVNDLLFSTEAQLMQTLRRTEVLDMKDKLSELGYLVFLTDSGQRAHGRIATLEKIFAALAAKMNKKFHENDNAAMELDPTFLSHSREDIGERLSHARKLCFWAERLEVSPATFEQPAIMARKTGNYHLAGELLQKIDLMSPSNSATKRFLVCTLEQSKMLWDNEDKSIRGGAWSQTFLALDKALMVENIRQQQLLFIANGGMPAVNGTHRIENCCEQISKAALKLADWISQDDELTAVLQPEIFQSPLWNQMESGVRSFGGDYSKFLVSLAAQVTPSMAKAHLRLGEWFYSAAENAYTTVGKENFINRYRAFMASVSEEAFDKLWELLFKATSLADLNESVGKLVDSSTATFFLGNGSKYIETWSQHQQHKISLLTGAINSYFAYIAQLGVKEQHTMGSVSATLRILGLLANNSDVLASIVTLGFSQTNDSLWKDILPQLFARLSHPNALVRDAIVTLLSKICISAPHSVVFQVVSGASSFVEESDDVIEAEDAEEQEIAKKEKTLMFECCQQLKVTLNEINPSLVADVQVFVNELQKISLLNEEKWTFVLSNLDHEMSKRLEQIRKETERTNSSPHLTAHEKTEIIAEKSQLITSSVYCILVDLYDRTCVQKPSTLNEELFVEEFGSELKKAFEQSKNSSKNPEKTWAPFRQFLSVLQQKNARRGAQILRIQDISTVLADLSGTSIPLPGQENNDYSEVVTLSRVGGSTQILPTKTRPKKMSFIGSDGKEQTFLFKGQEDLHLDERIMQALQICNLMLARSSKRCWPEYRARHYAVTPLGPRSGLIQWVGGATPLFFIYRKWQQRQAQIQHSLEKKNGAASAVPEVERPTDMYQKQLRSAFLKHKVEPEIIADRSKWPLNIQKEVFHNLQKETPKDLVSRELWMKAGSSDSWWRVCSRLARSTAVMSIVGAVLGLGDRHLDNLLINLDKGEVVHIDYNICFDKGKTLRVPETVPFRLTQNIAHAMGPTQTEGVFRESCCHVLENLRTNREVLLTILEAFVYDPLVDWTTTDHLTSTSAAVSVAVTLAVYGNDSRIHDAKPIARKMFSVRRKEYAVPWLRNYSDLTGILENLKEILLKMINGGSAWDSPSSLEQRKVDGKRKLQVALSDEQNMMKQFRSLMKTLATCDERFAVYLKTYKEHFHQPVLKVFHLLDSQDPEDRNLCLEKLDIVQEKIHSIYHDIFTIDSKELTPKTVQEKPDPSHTPPPGLEDRLVRNEQQEQNVYAQNAVRKVRARLEGRVEDARTLSVEEQVDYFIRHATSSSRLAQMYEGWTSWV